MDCSTADVDEKKEIEMPESDQVKQDAVLPTTAAEKPASKTMERGVAAIKSEYLLPTHVRTICTEYVSTADKKRLQEDDASQGSWQSKKKLRGQNKKRPRESHAPPSSKLCRFLLRDEECSYGGNCRFCHDVAGFWAGKAPDLGSTCYVYDVMGKCRYGLECRYASSHITSDLKNKVNEDVFAAAQSREFVRNLIDKDVQMSLRRHEYDFQLSDTVMKALPGFLQIKRKSETGGTGAAKNVTVAKNNGTSANENADEVKSEVEVNVSESAETEPVDAHDCNDVGCYVLHAQPKQNKKIVFTDAGAVTNEDVIKLRPDEIKKIDFRSKLYLAPLTTVGNLPFRRICKSFGADVTCGEMAMSLNLLQGQQSEWALLRRHESEDLFGVQLCGAYSDQMTRVAQLINEQVSVDFVDINVGCPIDLIYQQGAGCGLMSRMSRLETIVYGMRAALDVPLTVKIRTGIHENKPTAHLVVPRLRDWGVAMTTMHGRSREQRYTKAANWDYIAQCAKLADPMPMFGCGDILSYEEANLHMEQSSVSGIMIARGALIKPWIFTEIKEQRHMDISSSERLEMLKKFANYGLENWGSDTEGVEKTRKFLLEWLSFLYRYIPVGLLERLPQQINERPPFFRGRDDLETVMASPSCADWVKISEMLLGPVPEGFCFLPKHKANSYS